MKIQFHLIWYWVCFKFENDNHLNDIAEQHGYDKPNLKKVSLTVWKRKKPEQTLGLGDKSE